MATPWRVAQCHRPDICAFGDFFGIVSPRQVDPPFHFQETSYAYPIVKPGERILGVEGGGTKTAWALVETVAPHSRSDVGCEFRVLDHGKLQSSNFRLTAPERLRAILGELPKQIDSAGVFLAGCAT